MRMYMDAVGKTTLNKLIYTDDFWFQFSEDTQKYTI